MSLTWKSGKEYKPSMLFCSWLWSFLIFLEAWDSCLQNCWSVIRSIKWLICVRPATLLTHALSPAHHQYFWDRYMQHLSQSTSLHLYDRSVTSFHLQFEMPWKCKACSHFLCRTVGIGFMMSLGLVPHKLFWIFYRWSCYRCLPGISHATSTLNNQTVVLGQFPYLWWVRICRCFVLTCDWMQT